MPSPYIGRAPLSGRVSKVSFIVPSTMTPEGRNDLRPDAQEFLAAGNLNETSPGVHGYLAHNRQLESIFFASGPGAGKAEIGHRLIQESRESILECE